MVKMIRQAREMKKELSRLQKQLEEVRVEGSSAGGMVKVVVNGKKELISLSIRPEAVIKGDAGVLEDMIMAAIGQAMEKAESVIRKQLGGLTGGIGLLGLGR